jgi:hypothetical protein
MLRMNLSLTLWLVPDARRRVVPGALDSRYSISPNPARAGPTRVPRQNRPTKGATMPFDPKIVDTLCEGAPVCVLVGHYGVGKTNLALNLALAAAAGGRTCAVADFDVVNPYFRSSDYPEVLAAAGVRLVAPTFAGSTVEAPSLGGQLPVEVERAVAEKGLLVVDAGGDDAGATALRRFARAFEAAGPAAVRTLYVVNAARDLDGAAEAVEVLRQIEEASGLAACGVVNNTHLCDQTDEECVRKGRAFAQAVTEAAGLPLVATCVPEKLMADRGLLGSGDEPLVSVARYVTAPWG